MTLQPSIAPSPLFATASVAEVLICSIAISRPSSAKAIEASSPGCTSSREAVWIHTGEIVRDSETVACRSTPVAFSVTVQVNAPGVDASRVIQASVPSG